MRDVREYIEEGQNIRQTASIGLLVVAVIMGAALGYTWPDPGAARSYDLVQFNGDESDVIDFDQSATDCGLKLVELERAGLTGFCEVAR